MTARHRHLPALFLVAVLGGLALGPLRDARAGDLDAVGTLFFRLPLSADGQGFRDPSLGLRLGPSIGVKGGGLLRVEERPRFLLDRALALETDGRGNGRLTIAAFSWDWRMPALHSLDLSLGGAGPARPFAEDNLPRK